jgi:hypothetical protein
LKSGPPLVVVLNRLDESGLSLLAEAIAIASDGEDVAMVEQAVEDRGGDDGIVEDGAPFGDRPVAGEQDAAALVAARHELKEEVCGVALEGR